MDTSSSFEDFEPEAFHSTWDKEFRKSSDLAVNLKMMVEEEVEKKRREDREAKGLTVEESLEAELKISN